MSNDRVVLTIHQSFAKSGMLYSGAHSKARHRPSKET